MCRPICSPMAPSPMTPVRFTLSCAISTSICPFPSLPGLRGRIRVGDTGSHLLAPGRGCGSVDHPILLVWLKHDPIVALGGLPRNVSLAHIVAHALGLARERIAVAAAARRIEPKDVALAQRIIGIAGGQALGLRGAGIDPDVPGAAGMPAGAAVRRDHMLHGANGEAGVLEIEIFPPDAQAAAKPARPAGIFDQLEPREAGRKLALDDLDRRDHRIALIDRDAGSAVPAGARTGAAGDDLVLHVALACMRVAAAQDERAAAAAVGA